MSRGLKQALAELVNGTGPLPFRQLRQSARNFTGTELEKELIVYRHIQHWMPEVDLLLSTLSLSQKNLQHLAEESRLLRCQTETSNRRQPMAVFIVLSSNAMAASAGTYCRWLCASCQTDQTEGKVMRRKRCLRDWQKAAKNVSKAAEVLHLFIDDSIDLQLPFATVRQQALSLLTKGIWNLYVSS